ncbi:hypothetical protein BC828DRAFT_382515 [Blastocladiella britannica]|nr:hypothetical protein BC828DRAFT_382515 [Blastocladiella britannica]
MEGDLPSLSTLGSRMACIAHESGVTTLSDSSVLYMMHAMQTFLKNVLDPSLRLNSLAEETPSSSVMDLSSPPVVNAAIGAAAPAKDLLGGSSTTRELTLGPLANVITLQPSLVADSRGVVDRVLAYQWHKTEEELEVSRVLGNWSALLPPPSPLLGDDGEILDAPPSEDVTSAVVVGADLGASPAAVLESPRAAVTTAVTTTTPNEE